MSRSRERGMKQAGQMLDAARRLIRYRGDAFTTQELVKEAGVALQTFYRYFATKDELLLTLFGDLVAEGCAEFARQAEDLPDPIARLRFYITSILDSIDAGGDEEAAARFVVSAHWALQRTFPNDMAAAMRPFADLLLTEINAGIEAGLLELDDPENTAWLLNELVRSVHHHYAYAPVRSPATRDQLWEFCRRALGVRA
ncbi:TetR/AcrR family transcriptional regulator [Amycolatopsis sp. K13G38]|uniref:TetR/AcrR family transcriptional regulator n=1 Tax=Amycolatopsis acididurans TaxID=2724524 RepID=A0ABX1J2I0_9PSEU|nr:TetR/AcrR family transcriptional regulator [Amycolatopsis acididurans]